MREYFTEALALDKEELGERDSKVYLYTRELGKITAKVKSSRNILSKLNGHLEPFSFVSVRLIDKGPPSSCINGALAWRNPQAVDALLIEKLKPSWSLSHFLNFIKEVTLEYQPDERFWFLLKKTIANGELDYRKFLALQGFDPKHALCQNCQQPQPEYFLYESQGFLCSNCVPSPINQSRQLKVPIV